MSEKAAAVPGSSRLISFPLAWQVEPIVQAVKHDGDSAVKQFTEKFDRVKLETVCAPIEVKDWWMHFMSNFTKQLLYEPWLALT